ncbi:MAG: rod shape-determining protein RodA [Holosporaceae bacterium]|jgi:rod shape determining protein RodA|nr:rod shape-determining protein RodA [Holosporaceae bacterium]
MRIGVPKSRFFFPDEFKILFFIVFCLLAVSFLGQYSAFNGEFNGFVQKHLIRIAAGLIIMLLAYLVAFSVWSNFAYVFYAFALLSLIVVSILGSIKSGAQRWIDFHLFTFQPSELMKLALILALAKYYSLLSSFETREPKNHIFPFILTLLPSVLVLKQPDLGTAGILFCVGVCMIFLSGFPLKIFGALIVGGLSLCPFGWFFLYDYQKKRILSFLNPDYDPLGAGYHVLQSKIAIGSGHIFGRGFLKGTQSKLNFLPEKNTDFIFTTIAEEIGFIGAFFIILLFCALTIYFFWVASEARRPFPWLLCHGLGVLLFLHVFVNIAMVMGIIPTVGIPLPFLSYGGSSLITFMISCGLVMSALSHRKIAHKRVKN